MKDKQKQKEKKTDLYRKSDKKFNRQKIFTFLTRIMEATIIFVSNTFYVLLITNTTIV